MKKADELGFGLILLFCFAGPLLIDRQSVEPFGPVKFLMLEAGGLLLWAWVLTRSRAFDFFLTTVGKAVLTCLAAAVLSSAFALTPEFVSRELFRLFCLIGWILASSKIDWTPARVRLLTYALCSGALTNGVLVLAEHFRWDWRLYEKKGRFIGLFGYQNIIAQFYLFPLCLLIPELRSKSWFDRLILIFLTTTFVLFLCRGAWLGLFAFMGTGFLFWKKRIPFINTVPVWSSLLIGILLGIVLIKSPEPNQKVTDNQAETEISEEQSPLDEKSDIHTLTQDSGRRVIYRQCLNALKENPILGSGLGNFPVIYQKVDRDRGDFRRYAHNDLLQWSVETGLVGLAALFFLALSLLRLCLRVPTHLVGLAGALIATMVHGLVSYNLSMPLPITYSALALGALTANSKEITFRPLGLVPGCLLLLFCLPVVWAPIRSSHLQLEASLLFRKPPQSQEENRQLNLQALDILETPRTLTPFDPALLFQIAQLELGAGLLDKGLETLKILEQLTPYNERVHLLQAQIFAVKKNEKAQLTCLEKAYAVLPRSRPVLDTLWLLYSRRQLHEKRKSIETAYRELGLWHQEKPQLLAQLTETSSSRDLKAAMQLFSDQALVTGRASDLFQLGSTQFRLRYLNAALETFEKALKAVDKDDLPFLDADIRVSLGNTLYLMESHEEAFNFFNDSLSFHPQDSRILQTLWHHHLQSQNMNGIKETLSLAQTYGADRSVLERQCAWWLAERKAKDKILMLEGLDLLNRQVAREKSALSYLERALFVYHFLGDEERAKSDIQQGLKHNMSPVDKKRLDEIQKMAPNLFDK